MGLPGIHLERFSEPYRDAGNMSGRGATRLLGAPQGSVLETAIRESVQNSWDARSQGGRPAYNLDFRQLKSSELEVLRKCVFSDLPSAGGGALEKTLSADSVDVLIISDFGTTGLDGRLRGSHLPQGEKSRFVRFLRDLGTPDDELSQSGGTYGFGKSSLFALSRCGTIVVDSKVVGSAGRMERRLMASRIGAEFNDPSTGRRYTGRHWWGLDMDGEAVDPAQGDTASELSRWLGFPERQDDSGTSIMVVAPRMENGRSEEVAGSILRCLLWWFWPKMVGEEEGAQGPMDFGVCIHDQSFIIPPPDEVAPFRLFAGALREARAGSEGACRKIWHGKGRTHLGWLARRSGIRKPRPPILQKGIEGPEIPESVSHVALMRPVELVVKYMKGDPLGDQEEWGGAFVCSDDDEVHEAFADSEPPTHDDWNYGKLDGAAKSWVKVALSRIGEQITHVPDRPEGRGSVGLAKAADELGKLLLSNIDGDRVRRSRKGGKPGGGPSPSPSKPRVSRPSFKRLEEKDGNPVARFEFEVTAKPGIRLNLSAVASIALEGGERVSSAPGHASPEVLEIEVEGHGRLAPGDAKFRLSGKRAQGEILVSVPGVVVEPTLRVKEVNVD